MTRNALSTEAAGDLNVFVSQAAAAKKYLPNVLPVSRLVRNRVDAAVQSSPVTLSASTTSTLAQSVTTTGSPINRVSGAPETSVSGATVPKGTTHLDGTVDVFRGSWRRSFDFDGPAFEFRTTPQTDTRILVWVNEQPHAAAPVQLTSIAGTVAGTPTWVKVTIPGSRTLRRIMVEMIGGNNVNFNSLNKAFTDSIQPPAIPSPRMVWVGDSIAYGVGASDYRLAYPIKTAWLLGIDDVFNCTAQPSSGFIRPPSGAIGYYGQRFNADVLPLAPDILIVQASINDGTNFPQYLGQTGPAATAYLQNVQTQLPNCRIIVTSPIFAGYPSTAHTAIRDEVKAAVTALGIPWVEVMDATYPVFFGNGQIGATTNDGNADFYREADVLKTHPSDAGHDYLARWMAGKLAPLLGVQL